MDSFKYTLGTASSTLRRPYCSLREIQKARPSSASSASCRLASASAKGTPRSTSSVRASLTAPVMSSRQIVSGAPLPPASTVSPTE